MQNCLYRYVLYSVRQCNIGNLKLTDMVISGFLRVTGIPNTRSRLFTLPKLTSWFILIVNSIFVC